MNRPIAISAVLAGIAVGAAVGIAVSDDDDGTLEPPGGAQTSTSAETSAATSPPKSSIEDEPIDLSGETAAIERAVADYVEEAETGGEQVPGLPTSDELSIDSVELVEGRSARVRLAGGGVVRLVKKDGNWEVTAFRAPELEPTPPSGPP